MQNEAELHFFRKLLEQFHVNFRILGEHDGPIPELDLGLRRLLNPDTDYLLEFQRLCFLCKPQKIYKIRDEFFCHYFFFQLPENTNASYVLIGPYRLSSVSTESLLENAKKLFKKVNIPEETYKKSVNQVSGGEASRAGIVRAAINKPSVIFADEPTGALNSQNSKAVLDVLTDLNNDGQTIIMVTHDKKSALRGNRIIYLKDGKICGECNLEKYKVDDKERTEKLEHFLLEMGW